MSDIYTLFVEKTKTITIQPFNYRLILVLTSDIGASCDKRRKLFPHNAHWDVTSAEALHVWHPDRPLSMVLLPYEADVNTCSHEAFHVVWRIMEFINAKHENEIMAYTLGYVLEQIEKFVQKIGAQVVSEVPESVIKEIQKPENQERLDKGKRIYVKPVQSMDINKDDDNHNIAALGLTTSA